MNIINNALHRMADGYFKTDLRGRYLYYPWGYGRGYIIDSHESHRALRTEIVRALALTLSALAFIFLLIIFDIFFLPDYITLSIVIGTTIYALGNLALYVREQSLYWPHAEERMTYVQSIANNAHKSPPFVLGFAFTLYAVASIWFPWIITRLDDITETVDFTFFWLITLMCIYQTITLGWMIFIRLTAPKN